VMSWSSQIPGGRCCHGGGRSAPRSAIAVSAESSPPLRRRPSPRETRSAHAGRTTSCRTTPLAHEEGRRAPALSPSSQLFTTPATMQDVDQYYVPDSQDPAFADGFRDLSGRAVARAAAGGRRVGVRRDWQDGYDEQAKTMVARGGAVVTGGFRRREPGRRSSPRTRGGRPAHPRIDYGALVRSSR